MIIYAETKNGRIKIYKDPKAALNAVFNNKVKQIWVKGWICIGPSEERDPPLYVYGSFASGNGAKRAVLNGHLDLYSFEDLLYILKDLQGDKDE